jgi:hypothetical protein
MTNDLVEFKFKLILLSLGGLCLLKKGSTIFELIINRAYIIIRFTVYNMVNYFWKWPNSIYVRFTHTHTHLCILNKHHINLKINRQFTAILYQIDIENI